MTTYIEELLDRFLEGVDEDLLVRPVFLDADHEGPQVAYVSEGNNAPVGIEPSRDGFRISRSFVFPMSVHTYRVFRLILSARTFATVVELTKKIHSAANRELGIIGVTDGYDAPGDLKGTIVYQRFLFMMVKPEVIEWSP